MKKLQINIYDNDLGWMGQIEEVESLVHRSSWNEIINSELRVSKKAANYNELYPGRILVVNNQLDKALIIEELTTTITDNFTTFICNPLKGILNWRVLTPMDSPDYIGESQSSTMMDLVRTQLITQTRDTNRYFTDSTNKQLLSVAVNKTYGQIIDFLLTGWDTTYLGDVLTNISNMNRVVDSYPIGWNLTINPTWDGFTFDTYQATDKSVNQTLNNPVVFSDDFANIQNISFTESIRDWRNFLYISFTEGTIPTYTTIQDVRYGLAKSFNRKELIASSNQVNMDGANNDGYSEMNKRPKVESFTAEIVNNPNTLTTFGVDWFLGDVVTVQSKQLNISVDTQVTEIEEIYADSQYSLNVTFGKAKLSLIKLIKNDLNQLNKKG
jgi:hypothetical protein